MWESTKIAKIGIFLFKKKWWWVFTWKPKSGSHGLKEIWFIPLVLLLIWGCYSSPLPISFPLLPLLLFFHYCYSFLIVVTLLTFSFDEVIKILIIWLLKMILINANFNNQIVKTCFCCIYENHLFENWVCLKKN